MLFIVMMIVIPGAVLVIDRYKYFLSDPAKAFFWFVMVIQAFVLIVSLIEGKPLFFSYE